MYRLYEIRFGLKFFLVESRDLEVLQYLAQHLGGNFLIERKEEDNTNSKKEEL
jgi:hypothetical protein